MKQIILTLALMSAGISVYSQYPIYKAPQAKQCSHLPDHLISGCTDSLFYHELMRYIDITACHNQDSVVQYNFKYQINPKGKVTDVMVTHWAEGGENCKEFFQKRAEDIIDIIEFVPGRNKTGKAIAAPKFFNKMYPRTEKMDSFYQINPTPIPQEMMPRFSGCENMVGSADDKRPCSERKLLQYLYNNLTYPSLARENGVQGRVYLQFVVDTTGYLIEPKIVRDIGAGCGKAALSVVESMNDLKPPFVPGMQFGKRVKVLYTLPVTFKLSGKAKKKRKKKR